MNRMTDWNRRKREIGTAFRRARFLPPETDPEAYQDILATLGLRDQRDLSILIAIVRDAIMQARREERPTIPLDTFLDWLEQKSVGG